MNSKMKILWISQNLPYPPKTGVLQRNYNLIREASKFADVHLVAILKLDILPGYDRSVAEQELRKLCRRVDVVELPTEQSKVKFLSVVAGSLFTRAPFTANWATADVLRAAIVNAVAETGPDFVYFDTISLAQYLDAVDGLPTALNHHNIESHLFERRVCYERNPLKRAYIALEGRKLREYEAEVAGKFSTNTVVSELDGDRLRGIAPGARTTVLANGVDVDYFRARAAAEEHAHLLMVSGMNWFPNRDAVNYMARDIWPRMVEVMPGARLTIVGASPPEDILELARADNRVTVTGFVDDVRPYMERAQIYLCPMRDGGGTRLKILDALSMGMPIVATSMALEGIAVEPERDVLVAQTPDDFVRQIGRLLADDRLRQALRANGRQFAEDHFSWPAIGRRMHDDFRQLIEAGRRT